MHARLTTGWKDACNLVLGVWLAISPWVLSHAAEAAPAWNAHVVGVIIAVAAFSALVAFQKWEEWVNATLAAWLIVSPYLLGFGATTATWNQTVVGLLVGGLAVWSAMAASDDGVMPGAEVVAVRGRHPAGGAPAQLGVLSS